jgi:hypothetical protein
MDKLIENAPRIIEEAGKNPLALVALSILAISVLAFLYFREASEVTRIVIFVLMGFGALILIAVLFSPPAPQAPQPTPTQVPPTPAYPVQPATPIYSPPQVAMFCCDVTGLRRCQLVAPAVIGSSCFCIGQGAGISCP